MYFFLVAYSHSQELKYKIFKKILHKVKNFRKKKKYQKFLENFIEDMSIMSKKIASTFNVESDFFFDSTFST